MSWSEREEREGEIIEHQSVEERKDEGAIPVRLLARLDDTLFAPDSLEEEQCPWYRRGATASASPASIRGSVPIGGLPLCFREFLCFYLLLSYCPRIFDIGLIE